MYHYMLWHVVKRLLNHSDIYHICFLYDTKFKLGDVYASALTLRFEELTSSPAVPLEVSTGRINPPDDSGRSGYYCIGSDSV